MNIPGWGTQSKDLKTTEFFYALCLKSIAQNQYIYIFD